MIQSAKGINLRAKSIARRVLKRVQDSPLTVPCYYALDSYQRIRVSLLARPSVAPEDVSNVENNLTFIYKSFNRQRLAAQLYHSIRSYYPQAHVVIADDSEIPLQIDGAEIIHLPFNSGLSKGLIAALEVVQTPYVMRLDDDLVLTNHSRVHEQLNFLQRHPEVDLCAIQMTSRCERRAALFQSVTMGKDLLIPAGTVIDGRTVAYKTPNCFVARTKAVREVGYDPNIRMIDHHEFFYRAAGQIVCVQDPHSYVFHCCNPFNWRYRPYRSDIKADSIYIWHKHRGYGQY